MPSSRREGGWFRNAGRPAFSTACSSLMFSNTQLYTGIIPQRSYIPIVGTHWIIALGPWVGLCVPTDSHLYGYVAEKAAILLVLHIRTYLRTYIHAYYAWRLFKDFCFQGSYVALPGVYVWDTKPIDLIRFCLHSNSAISPKMYCSDTCNRRLVTQFFSKITTWICAWIMHSKSVHPLKKRNLVQSTKGATTFNLMTSNTKNEIFSQCQAVR